VSGALIWILALLYDLQRLARASQHNQEGERMTLDELLAKVEQDSSVDDSIITLVTGVSQQLKDLQATIDPEAATKLQAISDALDANIAKVQAAVVANTPAA
jgi:hypothetical protein